MKYDLSIVSERERADKYYERLKKQGARIQIKKFVPKRSLNQNDYWYKLLDIMAKEIGEDKEYLKQVVKWECAFYKEHKGRIIYRSSADLDKKEFGKLIDKTVELAEIAGIRLPTLDQAIQFQWETC